MTITIAHFTTISGHFSANCMFIFHKKEIQTVILRYLMDAVGLGDISGFAKYEVSGSGAAAWLDQLLAAAIPPIGRMTLAPMLKDDGKIIGEFSLARLGDTRFLIIGSGIAESCHMRWFLSHLPDDGSVQVKSLGLDLVGLTIAGPKAR